LSRSDDERIADIVDAATEVVSLTGQGKRGRRIV
jgi:hypothetical protein